MAEQTQNKIVNGMDVGALAETMRAIRRDPSLGEFHFRATNKWQGGTLNRTEIEDFYGCGAEYMEREQPFTADNDEPPMLLGGDTAPNPVEWLLHALAGCVTTTTAAHAAARGIHIESIESELEGDIDVRGFLGLSDTVPRGYQNIRVRMKIKSDAAPEILAELAQFSPVFDTIMKSVPVAVQIEKQD